MTWLRRAPLLAVLLAACNDPDLVDPPPVNPAISNEAGPLTLPLTVNCSGPADELALLGDLCGSSSEQLAWWRTEVERGEGLGTWAGGGGAARLLIFAEVAGDHEPGEDVAAELAYAAYVLLDASDLDGVVAQLEQWSDGEAVASGQVRTARADFVACDGEAWTAEGAFRWRETTIELAWQASLGC